jgi:hypothetical protein
MKIRGALAALAAVTLAAAPAVAEGEFSRVSAPVEGTSEAGGGSGAVVLAIGALAAIIGGIIIAAGSDDTPISA